MKPETTRSPQTRYPRCPFQSRYPRCLSQGRRPSRAFSAEVSVAPAEGLVGWSDLLLQLVLDTLPGRHALGVGVL
jgi:hypothetical protein